MYNLFIGDQALEITNNFTNLGIEIRANGNFTAVAKRLCEKVSKSLDRLKRTLFSKYILGVWKHLIISETGSYPCDLKILKRVSKCWYRVKNCDTSKLLYDAYRCNCELMSSDKSNWLHTVKNTFVEIRCENIWTHGGDEIGDLLASMTGNLIRFFIYFNGKMIYNYSFLRINN